MSGSVKEPHLGRQVAIKALPDAVAEDAARLARFERAQDARLFESFELAAV